MLTGVEDPCARLERVAPQRQVSATAKYNKATGELQKVTGLGGGFQRQDLSTHEEEKRASRKTRRKVAKAKTGRSRRVRAKASSQGRVFKS